MRDAGTPIPAEASASVFDLESVAEAYGKRSKEGNGFGLYLARRLVELHGGQVGAAPSPEGGAMLWIRLPGGDLSSLIGSDPFLEQQEIDRP